jgi:outer membrane protein OmpA-like peptidoglycan-associated protein/tetratricopeptide (TPR) repeat protein
MRLRPVFVFFCVLLCFVAYGQESRKGSKLYAEAIRLKAAKHTEKAYRKMRQAIGKDPKFADAYAVLGEWYYNDHRFAEAADVLHTGSLRCQNGGIRFARAQARSYLQAGHPEKALMIIGTYATIKDSAEWRRMSEQAYFVQQAMAQPVTTQPRSLGAKVNSPVAELYPCMTADTQTLFFTRRVNNIDEDFFKVKADTCGGWHTAVNLGAPPNTPDQECAQTLSADGHYLFFTRCDNRSLDAWTDGGCDLFMAYRVSNDSPWTTPQPFGGLINTPEYEGMPSLSPDNNELYFVSNRPGGYGGMDIWVSRFEYGLWQEPQNAGPAINSAGNETAPHIGFDNKTLYFTSDGKPGMGGNDLFMSRRTKNGWMPAMNMGYPINTAYEEKSTFVTLAGDRLFFSSDRNGPAGNYDVYEATLPRKEQPDAVSYLEGYVYDSITKDRLNSALIYVCNAQTGDTLYNFRSNRGDASYLITLPSGYRYVMYTEHIGHTAVADTFLFDTVSHVPILQNTAMLPANWEDIKPINDTLVGTLHFDVNRVALSDADKSLLKDAIAPWLGTKGVVVYVNAYTDNLGTPIINDELSTRRANMVAAEIQSIGLDETMVRAKGWGEAKMIATNDTEDGRRMNRRVEIIVKR